MNSSKQKNEVILFINRYFDYPISKQLKVESLESGNYKVTGEYKSF